MNNRKLLEKIIHKFDFIYHFASHQDHQKDYSSFINDNVHTTSLIFETLKNKKNIKLKQFILASSQAVYGEGFYKYKNKLYKGKREYHNLKNKRWYVKNHSEKFLNHKENNSTLPINFYGLSKLFQEQIVKQCSSELSVDYTILRYSIVQGARQSFFNTYSGLCRNLISTYLKNERPIIFEDGYSTRDFVNIGDVTKANKLVLNSKKAFNQIFNSGGGKSLSLNKFDELVRNKLDTQLKPIVGKYFRVNDPRDTVSDIKKAKKLLNWVPRKSAEKSIEEYVEWVLKNKKALKFSKNDFSEMIKNGSAIDCN